MSQTRREFWTTVGAAITVPLLWEHAEAEVQDLGEVSAETVKALLELQGGAGIYANPERLEELRSAVSRVIRSHQRLRSFPIPDDVQPAVVFRRNY